MQTKEAVFLSASIPVRGRAFYDGSDPFLIQIAVRELLNDVVGRVPLIWGGHPAINPMVLSFCEEIGLQYQNCVKIYQSDFFRDRFPDELEQFTNKVFVPAAESLEVSLRRMREVMFKENEFYAGVFIGGMEGIIDEYNMFRTMHPHATLVTVGAPGGASQTLINDQSPQAELLRGFDFSSIYEEFLKIPVNEARRDDLM